MFSFSGANSSLAHYRLRSKMSPRPLPQPQLSDTNGELAATSNHRGSFRHGYRSARVQQIKQVRALQCEFVSGEKRKALEHFSLCLRPRVENALGFRLIQFKLLPNRDRVRVIEAV